MNSIHDIPGDHKQLVTVPKLAAATVGEFTVFVAPFKCHVTDVSLFAGTAWAGANDATNYNRFVLYNCGVNGTATAVALGTVSGSPTGTVAPIGSAKAIYTPTTPGTFSAGNTFVLLLGTVGTGTTEAPAMTVVTTFRGG